MQQAGMDERAGSHVYIWPISTVWGGTAPGTVGVPAQLYGQGKRSPGIYRTPQPAEMKARAAPTGGR